MDNDLDPKNVTVSTAVILVVPAVALGHFAAPYVIAGVTSWDIPRWSANTFGVHKFLLRIGAD